MSDSIDFNAIDWSDEPVIDEAGNLLNPVIEDDEPEEELESNPFDGDDEFVASLEEEPTNITDVVDAADDNAYFNFGDGIKLSKREVRETAKKAVEIKQKAEFIDATANSVQHLALHHDAITAKFRTETEKAIEFYEEEIENDDAEGTNYRKYKGKLAEKKAALKVLDAEAEKAVSIRNSIEANAIKKRIADNDEAMIGQYGSEWAKHGKQIYDEVMEIYKIPASDLVKALGPGLTRALIDARKFKMMENAQKAKDGKKVKALVARSTSQNKRSPALSTGDTGEYIQKLSNGTATKKDLSRGFAAIDWKA